MKTFIPLENNPTVLTPLAHTLGLSPSLTFHDVFSLNEPSLLAHIPRPVHALIFTYPHTPTTDAFHQQRLTTQPSYTSSGTAEPIFFVKQTITNACGLMALVHASCNGEVAERYLEPGSTLARLLEEGTPLTPSQRSNLLESSAEIESAYASVAKSGDSTAPELGVPPDNSFIAFVRGRDGHLWEMGGSRGPIDLGELNGSEGEGKRGDLLGEEALEKGPREWLKREIGGVGEMMFSCVALGSKV